MPNKHQTPACRLRPRTDYAPRPGGRYVLYWATAQRRTRFNFALDHAVDLAAAHDVPVVVLEAVRAAYPWASPRLHAFILEGMATNVAAAQRHGVTWLAYAEREPGDGRGLLDALAHRAVAVVGDDAPYFFLPKMRRAAARQLDEQGACYVDVDSCGLLPLRAIDKAYARAYGFRRRLQEELPDHLRERPSGDPLARCGDLPSAPRPEELARALDGAWTFLTDEELASPRSLLESINTDAGWEYDLPPVDGTRGGSDAGREQLERFLDGPIERYADRRRDPDGDAESRLSPYLHFGHVGAHEVFEMVMNRYSWSVEQVSASGDGSRRGWWGLPDEVEAFLDELITWRELGLNAAQHDPNWTELESIPDWARKTLEQHAADERPYRYSLEQFAQAETHDELWNAAQRELATTGEMHNYLRMLWGKKILHWTRSPREAFDIMIELNNRYALDGRDPNSYTGILWVLGKFDRAWGPEREVFGKVRYMTCDSARRKLKLDRYLERWGGGE